MRTTQQGNRTMTRQKIKHEIARCDALAIQNEKDGNAEAAKQYRELAKETSLKLADYELERLRNLLQK